MKQSLVSTCGAFHLLLKKEALGGKKSGRQFCLFFLFPEIRFLFLIGSFFFFQNWNCANLRMNGRASLSLQIKAQLDMLAPRSMLKHKSNERFFFLCYPFDGLSQKERHNIGHNVHSDREILGHRLNNKVTVIYDVTFAEGNHWFLIARHTPRPSSKAKRKKKQIKHPFWAHASDPPQYTTKIGK